MKYGVLLGVVAAHACLFIGVRPASAQDFAGDGSVVLGAERMTGFFSEKFSVVETTTISFGVGQPAVVAETESELSSTSFAFLGNPNGFLLSDSGVGTGPSLAPRLGLDVFLASGFSIGGSFIYTTTSGTTETTATSGGMSVGSGEQDRPTGTLLIFAPRVGLGYAVGPTFAIWPRVGISHAIYSLSQEDEDFNGTAIEQTSTLTLTDVSLEFMMAVTPFPHVAIVFGPLADIGVAGSFESETSPDPNPQPETSEIEITYTTFGLSAGLAVVF